MGRQLAFLLSLAQPRAGAISGDLGAIPRQGGCACCARWMWAREAEKLLRAAKLLTSLANHIDCSWLGGRLGVAHLRAEQLLRAAKREFGWGKGGKHGVSGAVERRSSIGADVRRSGRRSADAGALSPRRRAPRGTRDGASWGGARHLCPLCVRVCCSREGCALQRASFANDVPAVSACVPLRVSGLAVGVC